VKTVSSDVLRDKDINGESHVKARLQERILQLTESNRACLLGTELALFFAQNSQNYFCGIDEGKRSLS
jgi:hypothetical protein